VRCTKGTYVRTLAYDLGRKLGPGAHSDAPAHAFGPSSTSPAATRSLRLGAMDDAQLVAALVPVGEAAPARMSLPLHLAIGAFDGVHLGHRAVLHSAREAARADGGIVGALTYDPHPSKVLRPESPVPLIFTRAQKDERLPRRPGPSSSTMRSSTAITPASKPPTSLKWLKQHLPPSEVSNT
jgi:hypothetical protein